MSLSIVIGTFGDDSWKDMAQRALDSVYGQTVEPASVSHIHASTLHDARNYGASAATGTWVCFLDADDTLDSHFVEAMEEKIAEIQDENAILQPSHRNSRDRVDGKAGEVVMKPYMDYRDGNSLIIGCPVRRDIFMSVNGFQDLPMYEDWDLWIRIFQTGAKHHQVHKAIYDIQVRENSRNSRDGATSAKVIEQIRRSYGW